MVQFEYYLSSDIVLRKLPPKPFISGIFQTLLFTHSLSLFDCFIKSHRKMLKHLLIFFCFSGQINNATPHTNYSIKIAACTGGGCTESTDGVVVFTNQEGNS